MDFMAGDRVRILERRMGSPRYGYEELPLTEAEFGTVVTLWKRDSAPPRVVVRPDGDSHSLVFEAEELRLADDGGAMTAAVL